MKEIRHSLPSLNALAVFEAAGRLGGFTKAAEELRISQPAVTRHIRGLEESLGRPLFVRSHNRIALTEAGLRLWHAVNTGFGDIAQVVEALRRQEEARSLTFATHSGFGQEWLMPRLNDLRADLGGRTINLAIVDSSSDFDRTDFDVAVRHGRGDWPGMEGVLLRPETVLPLISAGLAAKRPELLTATPEDLMTERLIHMDEGDRPWMSWAVWFRLAGVHRTPPPANVRLNNYPLVIREILVGNGVGLGWRPLVDEMILAGTLVPVGPEVVREEYGWWLVWRDGVRDPSFDQIRRWIQIQLIDPP